MSVKLTVFDEFARLVEPSSRPVSVLVAGTGAGLEEDRTGKAGLRRMLRFSPRCLASECLSEELGSARRAVSGGGKTMV